MPKGIFGFTDRNGYLIKKTAVSIAISDNGLDHNGICVNYIKQRMTVTAFVLNITNNK